MLSRRARVEDECLEMRDGVMAPVVPEGSTGTPSSRRSRERKHNTLSAHITHRQGEGLRLQD